MEPFWRTQSYPKHLAPEINEAAYKNILEFTDEAIAQFPQQKAYSNMGTSISYKELDTYAERLAAYLQKELGLRKGDKIAIMMPNLLQYPVAVLAALRVGAVIININPLYTARELEHILLDSDAKFIIILENFAHTLEQVLPKSLVQRVLLAKIGDLFPFPKNMIYNAFAKHVKKFVPKHQVPHVLLSQALKEGTGLHYTRPDITPEDLAFLQYTGGTTGSSKGAMLSHKNIVSNSLQVLSWLEAFPEFQLKRTICPLPLYHIFALLADCFVLFKLGSESVLITNPRDMKDFLKTLKKAPFSAIIGVNTLFKHLLTQDAFRSLDFSQLKLTLGGGMAVERAVATEWKELTKCTLVEAYGLTEASPAVCINPPNLKSFEGSVGLPLPSTLVSIRGEDNSEKGINEEGELCIKGPQVFEGYWKNPEETRQVLSSDAWLKTGDIAKVDEQGFVHIMDRKKDIIIVSGFNVYPNEIEDVVTHHPKVREAAAVSVPDTKTGEAVKLYIVKKDESLTEKELIAYCRQNLVNYKVPRIIEWRSELPKSNVGKILRKDLKTPRTVRA